MFNIGFSELIVIFAVAFIFVGPEDLPKVARWLGKKVRAMRAFIADMKTETGWEQLSQDTADIKREIALAKNDLDITTEWYQISDDIRDTVNDELRVIKKEIKNIHN